MRRVILTTAGTLLMALSLNIFLDPAGLVTGGAAGTGVIVEYISARSLPFVIPLWATNLMVNIPLIIWAYKTMGQSFTVRTLTATLLLSVFLRATAFLPPPDASDLTNAVFGGAIMGTGVGLVLAGGATTGGSDLLASLIHAYKQRLSISTLIFFTDVFVLTCGVFVFGAIKSLYSVLSVYISAAAVRLVAERSRLAKRP